MIYCFHVIQAYFRPNNGHILKHAYSKNGPGLEYKNRVRYFSPYPAENLFRDGLENPACRGRIFTRLPAQPEKYPFLRIFKKRFLRLFGNPAFCLSSFLPALDPGKGLLFLSSVFCLRFTICCKKGIVFLLRSAIIIV